MRITGAHIYIGGVYKWGGEDINSISMSFDLLCCPNFCSESNLNFLTPQLDLETSSVEIQHTWKKRI